MYPYEFDDADESCKRQQNTYLRSTFGRRSRRRMLVVIDDCGMIMNGFSREHAKRVVKLECVDAGRFESTLVVLGLKTTSIAVAAR